MLLILVIAACGGGGGGGTGGTGGPLMATIEGRVFNVDTGGPPVPQASVTSGGASTLTSVADGAFTLSVPQGTTSLAVDTKTAQGIFNFTIPPATGATPLGDFWVGPQRVTVKGRVLNASNSQAVFGAQVSFAGKTGTTDPDGNFSLAGVAYSNANQTAFWGIHGFVRATGFLTGDFTAQNIAAQNGIVNVGDVQISPTNNIDPPPSPFNLWGRVSPSAQGQGTLVTLKQNGTALLTYIVGADVAYYFWVVPGTYTLSYQKGGLIAPDETVTIKTQNEVIRRDVTLQ